MKAIGLSTWTGTWKQGKGTISTNSSTLRDQAYTYASRFEGAEGASPEELLAAAHAGCYNQALANACRQKDLAPELINTNVNVDLGFDEVGRPEIKGIHFTVTAKVPGLADDLFQVFANQARLGCAISKIINIETTIEATLVE